MALSEQETIDLIATRILVDAKGALASLRGFDTEIESSTTRIRVLKGVIKSATDQMGGDFKRAEAAVKKFAGALTGIRANEVAQAGRELQQLGDRGTGAFQRVFNSVNTLRIALGALTSMLLFQVIQAFTSTFSEASKQARQLEETVYRLGNAERALSLAGIEISLEGLEEGITRIQKLLPIFSREDVTQLVGTVAVSTKQLGFTQEEILQLSQTIALLNIQSEKSEDLATTRQHVVSALLAGNSKGVAELGVTFNAAAMEEKALELGLIQAGDAMSDLSDDTKAQIKLALLHEAANLDDAESLARLNEFLETNTAKIQTNASAWRDLLTTIGQGINNLLPQLDGFFSKIQETIEVGRVSSLLTLASPKIGEQDWQKGLLDAKIWAKLGFGIKLTVEEYERLKAVLSTLDDQEILKLFPDPSAIKDRFTRELIQSIVEVKDTATEAKPAIDDLIDSEAEEKTKKALEDIQEKIQDIILDAQQAQEDLDLKLTQKQGDLDLEYQRKEADAATNHAQKLVDINQDAVDKAADAKAKSREDEKKAEQDLLQKLKELRQRFLLDLEDALHARDARQILRLIKEYKLEKQNILDRKKLDDTQRKDKLAEELRQIEIDRKRRIEQEKVEYKRKLADLAENKKREQAELALWYAREQEDIQRNVEQKLEKILNGYIAEGKIHAEQQAVIQGILAKYFGEDMAMVDRLAAYMSSRFAQMAAQANAVGIAAYQASERGSSPNFTSAPSTPPPSFLQKFTQKTPTTINGKVKGYAEGGTLFARQPTLALFGEKSPEFAQFTPLSQMGRTGGGSFAGGGGMDGELVLDVSLSPDLEARIVRNTMNKTASIVTKISRSKG